MKFLKLELITKCYTDNILQSIEIETGEIVAIFQVGSIEDPNELYKMVSHLIRHLYNKDFALVFDLEEKKED